MSNLLVELSDMARQITAEPHTRSAKLEMLIREADEKIAAMKSSTGSSNSSPSSSNGNGPFYADLLMPLTPAQQCADS